MKTTSLRLISDFRDYYDHAFASRHDNDAPEFRRVSTEGPTRHEAFDILKSHGFLTPAHGMAVNVESWLQGAKHFHYLDEPELWKRLLDGTVLVAYPDEMSHHGEGKYLITAGNARIYSPDVFCSVYYPPSPVGAYGEILSRSRYSVSYRRLWIGRRSWWLRYSSEDEWRSNCGDVEIHIISEMNDGLVIDPSRWPLLAIDFIPSAGDLFAIDLNTAPSLRHTGISDILTPTEVYDLIRHGGSDHA